MNWYILNEKGDVINFVVWDGKQDVDFGGTPISESDYQALHPELFPDITEQDKIVPDPLSRFQALTILKLTKLDGTKTLYQATDDYINSLDGDTVENITAKTAWETAQIFKRNSALIGLAQKLFKLTDEQVDEMFKQGAKITA